MKFFTLSIVIASLTLIGCGSSSKSSEGTPKNATEVKTVKEAEKSLYVMGAYQLIFIPAHFSLSENKQTTGTIACADSGSKTYVSFGVGRGFLWTFNKCQSGNVYIDGTKKTLIGDDGMEINYDKMTFKNVRGTQYLDFITKISEEENIVTSRKDGVLNLTTKAGEISNLKLINYVTKTKMTSDELWATIVDGTLEFESKCVTGTYVFETVETLVDARDGSVTESGILKINGATYTYDYPDVTIEAGSESETMSQSELNKRVEESSSCSI